MKIKREIFKIISLHTCVKPDMLHLCCFCRHAVGSYSGNAVETRMRALVIQQDLWAIINGMVSPPRMYGLKANY